MSDEQDKPVKKVAKDEPQGPVGGERLAQARREQQVSVLEVAKELHLDEPKVRALERNDFEVLGAPVFAKGHLRKYAQLVGVDDDDVFADYYQLTRSEGMPPVVVGRKIKVQRELSPGPWIAAIIVILAAVAVYWWIANRDAGTAPEMDVPETDAPEQVQEPDESAVQPVVADTVVLAAAASDASADDNDPIEQGGLVAETPEPVLQDPPDGQLNLALTFSGDCWTEITDADGRRLFFNMGRSGRTVELSGRAPIRVLFGNADNVSVRVNGGDYTIPASARDKRTARLSILTP